mgnify:CR=1 FL=1
MQIFLGIVGDDLDPAMVSATLGGQPHRAGRKGDPITAMTARGRVVSRPAIAGYWQRTVSFDSPASADAAVRDLFSGLTDDAATWRTLGSRFCTVITVHETPPEATPQTLFSASVLTLFQQRGLPVHVNENWHHHVMPQSRRAERRFPTGLAGSDVASRLQAGAQSAVTEGLHHHNHKS